MSLQTGIYYVLASEPHKRQISSNIPCRNYHINTRLPENNATQTHSCLEFNFPVDYVRMVRFPMRVVCQKCFDITGVKCMPVE